MIKYTLEQYSKGNDIYTNLGLRFPKGGGNIQKLNNKFFENYAESGLNLINSVILIDEAHVFFDSRNSLMRRNKIFGRFVTQSRKRSVNLVYTTQDKSPELFLTSGQVDLRLRKLTDYIVFCERIEHNKKIFIKQTFCDQYGLPIYTNVVYANPYFKYYDTNEIISFDD